jgi:hypothetical protein
VVLCQATLCQNLRITFQIRNNICVQNIEVKNLSAFGQREGPPHCRDAFSKEINTFRSQREREIEGWAWHYRPAGAASSPTTPCDVRTRLRLNDLMFVSYQRQNGEKTEDKHKIWAGGADLKETYHS